MAKCKNCTHLQKRLTAVTKKLQFTKDELSHLRIDFDAATRGIEIIADYKKK